MRKLDRTQAVTPTCLLKCLHNIHEWGNKPLKPTKSCRDFLWNQIINFQNGLCAYCETKIVKGSETGHIEHFFDKGDPQYKYLTFEWNNLFGCCNATATEHCGHYKDAYIKGGVQRQPDYSLLIKPDIDDPELFLQFTKTGRVQARGFQFSMEYARGGHTIAALNLNDSGLKNEREAQINRYETQLLALNALIGTISDVQFNFQYALIKQSSEKDSFRTAVKQVLFS